MTDKAYIVANEQQEREVLHKFELKGYVWFGEGEKPTEWVPSHIEHLVEFPYALLDDGELSWCYMSQLDNQKIVYDGRKEEQMKISKEVYDALVEWKSSNGLVRSFISSFDIHDLPLVVKEWWNNSCNGNPEINNRLIAIIRWVNGEDVFEVEKSKKWVVRSKECDEQGNYLYIYLIDRNGVKDFMTGFTKYIATKFDTKEEAESWANAHQEVIQVEVDE